LRSTGVLRRLRRFYQRARLFRSIVVARDLTRFLRSASYHRWKNREARPTPEEFADLRELTWDAVLATVIHPSASEADRMGAAIERSGKAGRPVTSISADKAAEMFADLECCGYDSRDRPIWSPSLRELAAQYGVPKSAVAEALNRPSGDGRSWREVVQDWMLYGC
jgi:hypothetical protein